MQCNLLTVCRFIIEDIANGPQCNLAELHDPPKRVTHRDSYLLPGKSGNVSPPEQRVQAIVVYFLKRPHDIIPEISETVELALRLFACIHVLRNCCIELDALPLVIFQPDSFLFQFG